MGEDSISACTGFSVAHVRLTLESPAYQEWVNSRLRNAVSVIDATLSADAESMRLGLRELVPLAIHRLEKALESTEESIALRAAAEILDRDARFTKAQNIAITHQLIPAKELERARDLARELRKQGGSEGETRVLDVTPKQLVSTTDIHVSSSEQRN